MKKFILFLLLLAIIVGLVYYFMGKTEPSTETFTVNGVTFIMVAVEGGSFTMGATPEQGNDANDDEKPTHRVTLSSFYIGQTEVTQRLWVAVMGQNPSYMQKDLDCPVHRITWSDCLIFIARLNQLTGKQFRLPTEAEWEYAARGGKKSKGYRYSGRDALVEVAWFNENSANVSNSPYYGVNVVGLKKPNELGLYDMSGNVSEWCQDKYGRYSSSSQYNPTGPTTGLNYVYRGGSWSDKASDCRVSGSRRSGIANCLFGYVGLRLAL